MNNESSFKKLYGVISAKELKPSPSKPTPFKSPDTSRRHLLSGRRQLVDRVDTLNIKSSHSIIDPLGIQSRVIVDRKYSIDSKIQHETAIVYRR